MAQALTNVWHRLAWSDDADAALGDLIAGQRDRVLREIEAGTAHLYRCDGPIYHGWLAFRFEEEDGDARPIAYVIAIRGMNARGWLDDFKRIVKAAGARAIVICAESAAHVRLYAAMGFEVEAAYMRFRDEFFQ